MKRSNENLSHFNCSKCQKWFSIGDAPTDRTFWYCPWCGVPDFVETSTVPTSTGIPLIEVEGFLYKSPDEEIDAHECQRGMIRPYPRGLCSLCPGVDLSPPLRIKVKDLWIHNQKVLDSRRTTPTTASEISCG